MHSSSSPLSWAMHCLSYYAWGPVWIQSGILCQLVLHGITPVLHINIYISLMILTCVALSRFASLIQITHASRPSTCTILLPQSFFTRLTRVSFASRVCAIVWVVAIGCIVPVTIYYSVSETMGSHVVAQSGKPDPGGGAEVCYSPAVEIGGSVSASFAVAVITMFFMCYLVVLMSYMSVLRHIRRSRHSTNVTSSQCLLGKVLRKIVIIQVVLSVCLLPYHIFKPIFISLAHGPLKHSPGPNISNHCHQLSTLIELKNCLLLLAALRGSTDPVMYFLLDKTFRYETYMLLRCNRNKPESRQICLSVTRTINQQVGQLGKENVTTTTVNSSHDSVL
ncbi:hypothetical protein PAMP_003547 [Pampus punctatissimus]